MAQLKNGGWAGAGWGKRLIDPLLIDQPPPL